MEGAKKLPPNLSEDELQEQVVRAKEGTLQWLQSVRHSDIGYVPSEHYTEGFSAMRLPATYNAVQCLSLLGALDDIAGKDALSKWVLSHMNEVGVFRLRGIDSNEFYKRADPVETQNYIDFHVTNYSLGALEALGVEDAFRNSFLQPYLDREYLNLWLAHRDLDDPWLEGNNIVNLASFLFLNRQKQEEESNMALRLLLDWHQREINRGTGFWGNNQEDGGEALLHAMCGGVHNYHLYHKLGVVIPGFKKAFDYCLHRKPNVVSACIDVDTIDILVHGVLLYNQDASRIEVRNWMTQMLGALLSIQNHDGGFPDQFEGIRRFDGWIEGYTEPQGISNCFATWFRWIGIAMLSEALWPVWMAWNFRKMIGIGYLCKEPYGS